MSLIEIKGLEVRFVLRDLSDTAVPKRLASKENTKAENKIRHSFLRIMHQANKRKIRSLRIPALQYKVEGFPAIGVAKILAQEILRFARHENAGVKEIVVCLPDKNAYKIFKKTIEGYIHHVQEDLGLGPYVTVDMIIELKEGIILIERSNPPYGWALPGGFVDYAESLEQAARREAKEETNMSLVDLRQFGTYSDPKRDPRFHTVSTVFIATGKGRPQFGDDARGLKIVKYSDLLKLTYAFDHKKVIKDYLVRIKR